jgi:hypothetical protein
MRRLTQALAALALAAAAQAAPDPGDLIAAGSLGEWKPLVAALAAKGPIEASFTESRYFPFRREPTVLKGVLRISPEKGLSLQYTDPEPSIMIADAQGLVLRDAKGRSREMAAGSREAGAVASLLPIMRFDLASLFPRFTVRARHTDLGWAFEFTPIGSGEDSLGVISVAGGGTDVRRLGFRRSASQRVEIEVGDTRTGVTFTAAELSTFFR